MRLNFNDGVSVDTSGPLRTLRLHDGWYVIGEGMMIPVADKAEATQVIDLLGGERRGARRRHEPTPDNHRKADHA